MVGPNECNHALTCVTSPEGIDRLKRPVGRNPHSGRGYMDWYLRNHKIELSTHLRDMYLIRMFRIRSQIPKNPCCRRYATRIRFRLATEVKSRHREHMTFNR